VFFGEVKDQPWIIGKGFFVAEPQKWLCRGDIFLRTFILGAIIFMAAMVQDAAGKEKGKMDPEFSWPQQVDGWKWDGQEKIYDPRTIFDYIDGAGELYLSYHFQKLKVCRFTRAGQGDLTAEVYDMGSSRDAYGIFSFERQDEEAGIGQGSEFGGGLLRFWKGKFFVSVYAEGEGPGLPEVILNLGHSIARAMTSEGPRPEIIEILPGAEQGLQERSIRYLHSHVTLNQRFFIATQNILLLGPKTEAVLAQYVQGQKKSHLLLVRYPTEEEGKKGWQSFKKAYMPDASKDRIETEDKKWTMGKQQGSMVIIMFGAPREKEGQELIQAVGEKIAKKKP
jgi:hypothetical protein